MPLEKGAAPGTPGFGRNVAAEENAGKPEKQAVAIAYKEAKDEEGTYCQVGMTVAEIQEANRRYWEPDKSGPTGDRKK